jgi:hypothetical protein
MPRSPASIPVMPVVAQAAAQHHRLQGLAAKALEGGDQHPISASSGALRRIVQPETDDSSVGRAASRFPMLLGLLQFGPPNVNKGLPVKVAGQDLARQHRQDRAAWRLSHRWPLSNRSLAAGVGRQCNAKRPSRPTASGGSMTAGRADTGVSFGSAIPAPRHPALLGRERIGAGGRPPPPLTQAPSALLRTPKRGLTPPLNTN